MLTAGDPLGCACRAGLGGRPVARHAVGPRHRPAAGAGVLRVWRAVRAHHRPVPGRWRRCRDRAGADACEVRARARTEKGLRCCMHTCHLPSVACCNKHEGKSNLGACGHPYDSTPVLSFGMPALRITLPRGHAAQLQASRQLWHLRPSLPMSVLACLPLCVRGPAATCRACDGRRVTARPQTGSVAGGGGRGPHGRAGPQHRLPRPGPAGGAASRGQRGGGAAVAASARARRVRRGGVRP